MFTKQISKKFVFDQKKIFNSVKNAKKNIVLPMDLYLLFCVKCEIVIVHVCVYLIRVTSLPSSTFLIPSFSFSGAPYRFFLLFLPWLPCHYYIVVIKQQQFCLYLMEMIWWCFSVGFPIPSRIENKMYYVLCHSSGNVNIY